MMPSDEGTPGEDESDDATTRSDGEATRPEPSAGRPGGSAAPPVDVLSTRIRVASAPWAGSTKIVVGVGLALAVMAGLYLARNALSLVALAGLVAFLVAPLIRLLQRRLKFPKAAALLVSYVLVLLIVLLFGALVVGGVVNSVSEIDPPAAAEELRGTAVDLLGNVRTFSIGGYEVDLSEAVDPLRDQLERNEPLDAAADEDESSRIVLGRGQIETLAGGLAASVQTVGGFIAAALASALVTFLVALYLNADSHKFAAGIRKQVPAGYEADAQRLIDRLGQIWRGYLYGQLINSLVTGLLVWLVLWAVGLPGAFVFGLLMAVLNMIPTFGPIIAAIPGVLAALTLGSQRLDWSNLTFALLIIGIYVLVVQVQANFMAPFITGKAVKMSPATILIGLIVGFQVGGLVGSLLVVPVLATLKEAGRYLMAKLLDRDPFEHLDDDDSDAADEDTPGTIGPPLVGND